MLVKKNKKGQRLLLPAQIADIYHVSRPTAGKWLEMAVSGENKLDIHQEQDRFFIVDSEPNQKELHLLREKGVKYKNRSDYEKIEINYDFIQNLDDFSKLELILAFENRQIPFKFNLQNTPELFGNEFEIKKSDLKKQYLQLKQMAELFISYNSDNTTYRINALNVFNLNVTQAIAEGFNGTDNKSILNIVAPQKLDYINLINKDLFAEVNYIESDFDSQSVATALLFDTANVVQSNFILLANNILNRCFDVDYTLSNLVKKISSKDYVMFNFKPDSVALDLYARDYFDLPIVQQRHKNLLEQLGIVENQYTLEYKYNDKINAHQYLMRWVKEIDFTFAGLKSSFREGDPIVMEQLTCLSLENLSSKIYKNGMEIVQSITDHSTHEVWMVIKKAVK